MLSRHTPSCYGAHPQRQLCVLLAAGVLHLWPMAALGEQYDKVPTEFLASDLLPKELLSADGYKIDEAVINDGVQNTYTLETRYGSFTVIGDDAVRKRIREIRATIALEELEDSDEFKEAAKNSVDGLVEGGKALVKEPVATSKSAYRGVRRWLGNVGSSIDSDDPYQDNALETAVGYDAVKRAYAIELGVDPYSDFQPLQEHLAEVAKVSTAGSMLTSMVISAGIDSNVLSAVKDVSSLANMKKLLLDNPPSALAEVNGERLRAMGVSAYQADALLKNYHYSPTEMTIMVEALSKMGDANGREIFVAFATSAPDEEVAQFMHYYAVMLAAYMNTVEPGDLVDIAGTAWLATRTGTLVGAFPIDYLHWTQTTEASTDRASLKARELGLKNKTIVLRGRFSPAARKALATRGWKTSEKVKFLSE